MRKRIASISAVVLIVGLMAGCKERSKEAYYDDGLSSLQALKPDAAVLSLKNAIELDASFTDARMLLGQTYLSQGRDEMARVQFVEAISHSQAPDELRKKIASLLIKYGRPFQSIHFLDGMTAKEDKETDINTLILIAKVQAAAKNFQQSEVYFKQALDLDPANADALLGLSQLFLASSRQDKAFKLMATLSAENPTHTGPLYIQLRRSLALGDRDASSALLRRIRQLDPADQRASYALGLMQLQANDAAGVRATVAGIRAVKGGETIATRLDGLLLLSQGKYKNAIAGLEISLKGMRDLPGYYFLGLAHYHAGDNSAALKYFDSAVKLNPDDQQANLMLAFSLYHAKRYRDSVSVASRLVDLYPRNALSHNVLGASHIALRQFDQAHHYMRMAIALDSSLAKRFLDLQEARFKPTAVQVSTAGDDFVLTLNPDPLQPRTLVILDHLESKQYELVIRNVGIWSDDKAVAPLYDFLAAQAYKGLGNSEKENEYIIRAKSTQSDFVAPRLVLANNAIENDKYESAKTEFLETISAVPGNIMARLALAGLYELMGQPDAAFDEYQASASRGSVAGVLAYANFLYRNDHQDDAIAVLKAASADKPFEPALKRALGESLAASGQVGEAISAFMELDKLQPGSATPFIVSAHLSAGDAKAAQELVSELMAALPCSEQLLLLQAAIDEYTGDLSAAEANFKDGVDICAVTPALQMKYAELLYKQKKFNPALDIYDKILQQRPADVPAIFYRGVVFGLQGDQQAAISHYRNVLELSPSYAPALNNLASVLCGSLDRCEEAISFASKAFVMMPNSHEVTHTFGYALLRTGQAHKAVKFLEKAVSLQPNNRLYKKDLELAMRSGPGQVSERAIAQGAL